MKQVIVGLNGDETRAYCGNDLDVFRKTYGLSMIETSTVFGQMSRNAAFKKMIDSNSDVLPASIQLLLRMYLRYPDSIPLPERLTVSDFFEDYLGGETAIATRFRGILFGVDRNSGYNWGKDATPISQVKAIMIAAKKIKEINHLENEELLKILLENFNTTTASLNVNPLKTGSWKRKNSDHDSLKLKIEDVSDKAVKNRGRRASHSNKSKLSPEKMYSLSNITRTTLQENFNYASI